MMNFEELKELILEWADDKDLLHAENADKQFMKFIEEVFEFKTETDLKEIRWDTGRDYSDVLEPMKDEMGDIFVTLIILCKQLGIDPVVCLSMAYEKIKDRKGKTIGGKFIKESDLL